MWARLQPGMRKGDVRSIEAGIRVMERKARLLGLDMPTKVAMTDPDGQGIPLETVRRVMERVDRQMVDVTPEPAPLLPAVRDNKRLCLDSKKPPGGRLE
jgi:hypothetical protein